MNYEVEKRIEPLIRTEFQYYHYIKDTIREWTTKNKTSETKPRDKIVISDYSQSLSTVPPNLPSTNNNNNSSA